MLRTGIAFLIVGTHCRFGPMTPLIPRARRDVWVSRMTEQILAMWVSSESEGVIYFNKLSSLHYQCPLRELELWTDIQKSSFPSLLRTCWTPYHVITKNLSFSFGRAALPISWVPDVLFNIQCTRLCHTPNVTDSRWCSLKRGLLRAYTHEQQEHPDLVHRKELSSRITYENRSVTWISIYYFGHIHLILCMQYFYTIQL